MCTQYICIFLAEDTMFPSIFLVQGSRTFLIKQKWAAFQQGPRLALSMKVYKVLQKLRNYYSGGARRELTLWLFAVFKGVII